MRFAQSLATTGTSSFDIDAVAYDDDSVAAPRGAAYAPHQPTKRASGAEAARTRTHAHAWPTPATEQHTHGNHLK